MGSVSVIISAFILVFPATASASELWQCHTTLPVPDPVFQKSGSQFQTRTVGRAEGGLWRFNRNGYIEDRFVLRDSAFVGIAVKARPLPSPDGVGAYWPELQLSIDGLQVATLTVDQDTGWTQFYVAGDQPGIHRSPVFDAGEHRIRVSFVNDWAVGDEGRDVLVEQVAVYTEQTHCTLPMDFVLFRSLDVIRALSAVLDVPVSTVLEERGGDIKVLSDPDYQAKVHQLDYLTLANPFKMASVMWDKGVHYGRADRASAYVGDHHKRALHGHTIIWDESPPDLPAILETPENFEMWLNVYVYNLMQRYNGLFQTWHVVNEPLDWKGDLDTESLFYKRLGPDYLSTVWHMAERGSAGQDVDLVLNENRVLDLNEKSDGLYREVARLLAEGHRVDGVGFQAHVNISEQPNFSEIRQNIDRFAALGVDVHITELDVRIDEDVPNAEDIQAHIYYQIVATCLEAPGCTSITFWGLSDRYSYLTDPGMAAHLLDDDLREKKAVSAVSMALFEAYFGERLID